MNMVSCAAREDNMNEYGVANAETLKERGYNE